MKKFPTIKRRTCHIYRRTKPALKSSVKKGLIFSITYRRFSSVVLSRIFRRVGADFENRLLDCTKPSLCMQLTNEFIHNNIHISSTDLQNFIELYFNEKQKSSRKFPSLQTIYSVL